MKALSAALCGLVLAALPCSSALADTIDFSFSFTGPSISGSGTFVTTSLGGDEYLIDSITGGEVNGTAITGLLATGSYPKGLGNVPNDNILIFPGTFGINSPSYFDNAGVSFTVGSGRSEYDVNLNDTFLFENAVYGPGNPLRNSYELDCVAVGPSDPGTSPVPEPGSLALLGTGVLGLAGALRRRLAL